MIGCECVGRGGGELDGARGSRKIAAVIAPARSIVAVLGVITFAILACSQRPREHRSVVLITIDTLRADHLHSYGFDAPVSPRIDELAARGVVFERAVAASAATAPSHAAIMTSLYALQNSIGPRNGTTRLLDEITLAESFRKAGYETAAFVSNVVLKRRIGLDRGFQVYDDDLSTAERNRPQLYERLAESTTRKAIEWLRKPRPGHFFLWVHYQDPHGPYDPPEDFLARLPYRPVEGESRLPVLEKHHGQGGIPAYQVIGDLRLPSQYLHRYAGEVLYADHWIGELLRALPAVEGGEDAIVLLTSDHGESFGEGRYYFAHSHATTPDLSHVPLILAAPELAPERRAELVSHVDVMPTLLDLAGQEVPDSVQGLALGRFLNSGQPVPGRVVFCDVPGEVSAYRDEVFLRVSRRISPGTSIEGYRWDAKGTVVPESDARPLLREIRAYQSRAVPVVEADVVDPDDANHLRALGYVDSESTHDE